MRCVNCLCAMGMVVVAVLALTAYGAAPPPAPPPLLVRPRLLGIVPGMRGNGWIEFSPDGRTFVVNHNEWNCDHTRTVQLWETASLRRRRLDDLPEEGIPFFGYEPAFTPDGRHLIVRRDSSVILWDLVVQKASVLCSSERRDNRRNPGRVVLSPDGRTLAIPWDGHTDLWDYRSRKRIGVVPSSKSIYAPVAFSADGATLAISGEEAQLWDVKTLQLKGVLKNLRECNRICFSPDGRFVATADTSSNRMRARLWSTRTHKAVADLQEGDARLENIRFSSCGRLLALGADLTKDGSKLQPGLVRFWDTAARRECGRLSIPGGLKHMAFSPADSVLAVSMNRHHKGSDMSVRVYRVLPPEPPRPAAPAARFVPDPKFVLPPEAARWWADLAGDNAEKAYDAVLALGTRPAVAVALLGRKLAPAPAARTRQRVAALIRDLASDEFAVRETASKELAKLGTAAEFALARAEGADDAEVRGRVVKLLQVLGPIRDGERLRAIRAAEALEMAGSDDARRLLAWLATGAPEATLTREASASLRRLERRRLLEKRP